MNVRCKSMDGNQYSQVFVNNSYVAKLYPMYSKRESGGDLRMLCQYFGVSDKLNFDCSK